jgi:hypothetical protein
MPSSSPALVALLLVSSAAASAAARAADAQTLVRLSADAGPATTGRSGRIDGLVRDQAGRPIEAVSIVAMGDMVASARSDTRGRFSLVVEPGEYVLRVVRAGYVSSYREAVYVRSSVRLEREITLTRVGPEETPAVLRAGMLDPPAIATTQPATGSWPEGHSHSEAAWRLRHLPRSVLRDGSGVIFNPQDEPFQGSGPAIDRRASQPARLADAFFKGTDFTGQVNFLTTSVLDTSVGWLPDTWPRNIAYFEIGSVSGSRGDWEMRGSIGGGDSRAWAVTGEYQSPAAGDHAVRFGVSYSAQGHMPQRTDRFAAAAPAAKNVAGLYAYDRWRQGAIELDFGARFDRYDYIATPELLSPRAGGRVWLPGRFFAVGTASRRMIAPGADEFLPPSSPGPWLPPERTFSSLFGDAPLQAAEVRHVDVGLGREFGSGDRTGHAVVRRVHQSTRHQIATIFGADSASDLGHYYVATPGSVEMRAWSVETGLRLAHRVDARVEYSAANAAWDRRPTAWMLLRSSPSVIRPLRERLHDLTTVVHADLPDTSTRVTLTYRLSTAFSAGGSKLPGAAGRFDVRVRQSLPYQPIRGAKLDVLVAARTLSREPTEGGSFFDELLTVSPPLRLMGGVQVRF